MIDLKTDHPCKGKNCTFCETCIFDEDIFQEKYDKENKKEMTRLTCNDCINLQKSYEGCLPGRYDVACKVATYKAFGVTRPRRIDYNVSPANDIVCPTWCPLRQTASNMLSLSSSGTLGSGPKPQNTGPQTASLTYSDKRELMKKLPKHVEWNDIKEGKLYVIPKILTQARKVVKVVTKTAMCCTCHEISEYTGAEYAYGCSIYPTDLDAVFITELHEF